MCVCMTRHIYDTPVFVIYMRNVIYIYMTCFVACHIYMHIYMQCHISSDHVIYMRRVFGSYIYAHIYQHKTVSYIWRPQIVIYIWNVIYMHQNALYMTPYIWFSKTCLYAYIWHVLYMQRYICTKSYICEPCHIYMTDFAYTHDLHIYDNSWWSWMSLCRSLWTPLSLWR